MRDCLASLGALSLPPSFGPPQLPAMASEIQFHATVASLSRPLRPPLMGPHQGSWRRASEFLTSDSTSAVALVVVVVVIVVLVLVYLPHFQVTTLGWPRLSLSGWPLPLWPARHGNRFMQIDIYTAKADVNT